MFAASKSGRVAAAATDPFFPYVPLLLETTSTNGQQNNTFLDSSTNNFTITRNGTPTQGSVTPYWPNGYWSGYFNGGNYVSTTPASANLRLDQGNWTLEFWVYIAAWNTNNRIFDTGGNGDSAVLVIGYSNTGQLNWGRPTAGTGVITAAGAIARGSWYHIALTSEGAGVNGRTYINGVLAAGPTNYTNPTGTTATYQLGRNNVTPASDWSGLQGYMSNFRFVSGQRLYTANFTPQVTPLNRNTYSTDGGVTFSAITGTTQLLALQSNRFVDNSVNNFSLVPTSTPTVQAFQPFSPAASYTAAAYGGSGYFNGSTDYLTAPNNAALALGAGDFTVEFWAYVLNSSAAYIAIDSRNAGADAGFAILFETSSGYNVRVYRNGAYLLTSSAVVATNAWNHVAFVRNGATSYLYLNGVQVASAADSNTYVEPGTLKVGVGWNTGNYFPGYISNLRIVKGTAVYTAAFTPPTAPVTAITNTSLLTNFTNAGIYDAAVQNNQITVGSAQSSITQYKWSPTSMRFNGTTDYLIIPSGPANFGTGDFTIEGWVNFSSAGGGFPQFLSASTAAFPQFAFTANTQIYFYDGTTTYAGTFTFVFGTWYYIAWVRASGVLKIYVNGSQVASNAYASAINLNTASVGGYNNGTANGLFSGYIQDLRITKYARTVTTVPTAAFPTR
jgi:hypothetical protein